MKKLRDSIYVLLHLQKFIAKIVNEQLVLNNLKQSAFNSTSIGISNERHLDRQIIVSLTTFNKRIFETYVTIESLLQQTLKPNMIILWLAKDEFSLDTIPLSLLNLRERGLQIRFCDDIKAYKKLVPSLECFPGEIIITADDDILYPRDFVESLVASYKSAPHLIHFCRGHQIRLTENNQPLPYNKWGHQITDTKESFLNFPTSGGGVLYPPDCFHKDITNRDTFMKLCPTADDVWYKAMSILKRTSCKLAYRSLPWEEMFIENTIHKNLRLFNVNVVQNQNDKQIQNVFDHYKLSEILTNIE